MELRAQSDALKRTKNKCWIRGKAELNLFAYNSTSFKIHFGYGKSKIAVGVDKNNNNKEPENTHTSLKQRNQKESNAHSR